MTISNWGTLGMIRRLSFSMGALVLSLAAGCQEPSGIAPALPPGVGLARVTPDRPEDDSEAVGENPTKEVALPLPEAVIRRGKLPSEPALPTKPGETVTTKTGLKYTTLVPGKGVQAQQGLRARVRYVGKLADGTEFDKSQNHPDKKTFDFLIGEGRVILGWDEGINGMLIGERRKLIVPPELGYGSAGNEIIPPNATLYFEIELVGLERDKDFSKLH